LPKLRHLELDAFAFPSVWDPQVLQQLTNLTSLRIHYDQLAFDILAAVGPKLKELFFLDVEFESPELSMEKRFEHLLRVFLLCPELESLEVRDLSGEVDLSVPVKFDQLKLKKFKVLNYSVDNKMVEGLLPLICRAQLLEEINLCNGPKTSKQDIDTLSTLLRQKKIFQNLVKFKDNMRNISNGSDYFQALIQLAKNIVSYCPNVQILWIDDLMTPYPCDCAKKPQSNSIVPFVDLVKLL